MKKQNELGRHYSRESQTERQRNRESDIAIIIRIWTALS